MDATFRLPQRSVELRQLSGLELGGGAQHPRIGDPTVRRSALEVLADARVQRLHHLQHEGTPLSGVARGNLTCHTAACVGTEDAARAGLIARVIPDVDGIVGLPPSALATLEPEAASRLQ